MKPKVLLILILILSFVLTACTAVTIEEPNATDTKEASATSTTETTEEDTSDETTAVDITEVETTEADTTETEETTDPFESVAVIPNQSYVGKWAYTFEIEDRIIEASDIKLTIRAVNSDSVIFGYYSYKSLELESVAIKKDGKYVFGKDISPYFDFDHYTKSKLDECNEITGSIEFFEDKISLTINEIDSSANIMFDVKHETGTSPRELPDDASTLIVDTIEILEDKGWEGIKRIKTEPDSLNRWGVVVPPYDPEYETVVYNLLGSCNGIDVVIRIVFNDATEMWETVEAYYASQDGILLMGETLETFMTDHGKTDFILSADDADLIEYFK